jgi:HSP20 family protein
MTNAMQKTNNVNVNQFGQVVDNIFNNTLRRFFDANLWDIEGPVNRGAAPVNVRESDQQYELDVIAPGCRKESFTVQVQNNELQISYKHDDSQEQNDEKAGWVRNEYMQHSFSRHFTLDETVNSENISATYTDGILRVILPKTEKAKPRLLAIDVK